jgi:hypothetical protein
MDLKKIVWEGVDWYLAQDRSCYECGTETSVSMKDGEFHN